MTRPRDIADSINRINSSAADATAVTINSSERVIFSHGITFNGDTADANTLDDYEEGTWTPSYSISGGSFNMSLQIGSYRKVGKIVMATARVRGQRVGGSGTLNLTGLPFTTNNVANLHGAVSIGFTNSWDTSPQAGFTTTNGTTISFKKNGSSNANSNLADDITEADTATSSTSSNDLILSVTYIAN